MLRRNRHLAWFGLGVAVAAQTGDTSVLRCHSEPDVVGLAATDVVHKDMVVVAKQTDRVIPLGNLISREMSPLESGPRSTSSPRKTSLSCAVSGSFAMRLSSLSE